MKNHQLHQTWFSLVKRFLNTHTTERTRQENPSDSPVPITSVSVEGNKSLLLLSKVQLRRWVLSVDRYLSGPSNLSGSVMSYLGLISAVFPEKDPWPPGLQRPWIDLFLVLLLSASPPLSPWASHSLSSAHILAARLRLPMSRRIKLNFRGGSQTFMPPPLSKDSVGGRRHTAVCLSVCLVEMLFSDLTRSSSYNNSMQRIQTALLPWHTLTLPIGMSPKLKGWFAQNWVFAHFSYLPCNWWTFHNPTIRVLKIYSAPINWWLIIWKA